MNTLARFQADFAACLLGRTSAGAAPAWATQPAFAVYRNTVLKGCIDALRANYPSALHLLGEARFARAAAQYAQQRPQDGRLVLYGSDFAAFLACAQAGDGLATLSSLARLDRLWTEAHCAADAVAAAAAVLAALPPAELGALRLAPHPATRWARFTDPAVAEIWQQLRASPALPAATPWPGDGVLLARPDDAVTWHAVSASHGAFLDACAQGCCLGEAAGAALQADPGADIARLLALLLQAGALMATSPADAAAESGAA